FRLPEGWLGWKRSPRHNRSALAIDRLTWGLLTTSATRARPGRRGRSAASRPAAPAEPPAGAELCRQWPMGIAFGTLCSHGGNAARTARTGGFVARLAPPH